jgi:predicted transcriptional regulator
MGISNNSLYVTKMKPIPEIFDLREAMKMLGITQRALASHIHMHEGYLSGILNESQSIPVGFFDRAWRALSEIHDQRKDTIFQIRRRHGTVQPTRPY